MRKPDAHHRLPWIALLIGYFLSITVPVVAAAEELQIGFTFSREDRGGMATVSVDSETGKITNQRVVFESRHCLYPKKLRPVGDGRTFVMTNDHDQMPYLFIVDIVDRRRSRLIELPGTPDEVRIANTQAIVTCSKDYLASVDIASRKILGLWDTSKELEPPANHPQDILVTPDRRLAVVSFQKDSPSGKKKGGRLALYRLPGMDNVADILLARDYPSWKLDESIRKEGPGLELIFLDEANNTILSTADHYGAVALMRWSDVKRGTLRELVYLSTAFDRSWGNSFPDRGTLLHFQDRSYCLICNAGEAGGSVLVDLQTWKIICRLDTLYGLEKPIFIPQLNKAFASCPGKRKRRVRGKVTKEYVPQPFLTVFEFDETNLQQTTARKIPQDTFVFHMGVLKRAGTTPLLVISAGRPEPNRLLIFDPATETILDSHQTVGRVGRFESD